MVLQELCINRNMVILNKYLWNEQLIILKLKLISFIRDEDGIDHCQVSLILKAAHTEEEA